MKENRPNILTFIAFFTAILFNHYTQANDNEYIVINSIKIEGNNKTKPQIILRELDFSVGDTLFCKDTSALFLKNKNKVFNTGLFVFVEHRAEKTTTNRVNFVLTVKENWYIWPTPYLDLGDRNFNEWWQERNKDFSRLIYGLHFNHGNFRGRNEKLKLKLEFGFTRKYELFYKIPYINKRKTKGLFFGLSYSENKKVAYNTENHKLQYLNSNKLLRQRFFAEAGFTFRPQFYLTHKFSARLNIHNISDSIAFYNPHYFGENSTTQRYFSLTYDLIYDRRDVQYFPLKGHYILFRARKDGIGVFNDVNIASSILDGNIYYQIAKNWFAGNHIQSRVSTPSKQPFYNTSGLGYNEILVRGFQLYVINGQHYFHNRNELKWRILNSRQDYGIIPFEQFKTIPISIFLTSFFDYGYVSNNTSFPYNPKLNNTSIFGYGLGLNIMTFYESALRIEAARNSLNEWGLFFHLGASF